MTLLLCLLSFAAGIAVALVCRRSEWITAYHKGCSDTSEAWQRRTNPTHERK